MTDLHNDAVDFVREHNCANHTPVELIEEAMNIGASRMAVYINGKLKGTIANLEAKRRNSQPHPETRKPIPYDPTIKD